MPTGPIDFDAEPQNVKLPPKTRSRGHRRVAIEAGHAEAA